MTRPGCNVADADQITAWEGQTSIDCATCLPQPSCPRPAIPSMDPSAQESNWFPELLFVITVFLQLLARKFKVSERLVFMMLIAYTSITRMGCRRCCCGFEGVMDRLLTTFFFKAQYSSFAVRLPISRGVAHAQSLEQPSSKLIHKHRHSWSALIPAAFY